MKNALLVGILAVAAALGFWLIGRPAYQLHKENRAVERARKFISSGDLRNAGLSARQALAANPRNLEACRIMAQLAELSRAPQVLDWRRRIVAIAPTPENKLQLAATAMFLERPPCAFAAQTLEEIAPLSSNSPAFHVVAAELALKLNLIDAAEAHFLAAERLEPANKLHQLNVAVLRLRSTNETLAAESRAVLDGFCTDTNLSRIALQWLVNDCLVRSNYVGAERLSKRLLADPRAGVADCLQHLTILQQAAQPEFATFLYLLENQVITNAVAVHGLANWMIGHNLAAECLHWLTNCPAKLRSQFPVPLALADAYMTMGDWSGLQSWLSGESWGDLEFVRLAALSRAQEQEQNQPGAEALWRLAVRQAGESLGSLNSLLGMAAAWGRSQAREELLWHVYNDFPRERWARRDLEALYSATADTRGLHRLYTVAAARDANDFIAKNNFAATALLLRTNLPAAHLAAREVHRARPAEPVLASTYAWSLQLQGNTRDALAVMEQLKPAELESPAVALYYGLLLKADQQSAKAARYLARVDPAALLPEEKALLATAQRN